MFETARAWIARAIADGQSPGAVRTDLPQTLMGEVSPAPVEPLDHTAVTHWPDLTPDDKTRVAAERGALLRRLLARDHPPDAKRPVGKDRVAH